jgi:hypothetical protein
MPLTASHNLYSAYEAALPPDIIENLSEGFYHTLYPLYVLELSCCTVASRIQLPPVLMSSDDRTSIGQRLRQSYSSSDTALTGALSL